jgi:DNA (cytosine-5)-methyltransferase 1
LTPPAGGFSAAGCRISGAVEHDEVAAKTLERNFVRLQPDAPPVILRGSGGDLTEIENVLTSEIGPPDILVGGPPCQGFSCVGRSRINGLRKGGFRADPRNKLYKHFLELAMHWKPRAIVMENVPGMMSVGDQNVAEEVANDMAELGYRVGYAILNAAWYGVPQYRERLFFMGLRNDLKHLPEMPVTTHAALPAPGYRKPVSASNRTFDFVKDSEIHVLQGENPLLVTSVQDALKDLPLLKDHLQYAELTGQLLLKDLAVVDHKPRIVGSLPEPPPYKEDPRTDYARFMRHWPGLPESESVMDHEIRITRRDFETFRQMEPGDKYPAALEIAKRRHEEKLDEEVKRRGIKPKTEEYQQLNDTLWKEIVPPYPEHQYKPGFPR